LSGAAACAALDKGRNCVILHEEEHDTDVRQELIAFIEKGTENTEGGTKVGEKVTEENDETPAEGTEE